MGFLILQISNLWKNYYGYILKKHHGLPYMQYAVLASIHRFSLHSREHATQAMLAKHIRIDPMTLSHIFRGLEANGYISRTTHPDDVRAKAIKLTPKGEELMEQVNATMVKAGDKFFDTLGKNTDLFNKCLKKLLRSND